jgi:transposase-like protein
MAKRGRLTKFSAELSARIVKDLSNGLTRSCAAARASICDRSLAKWLADGRAGKEPFDAFFTDVKKAERDAEAICVETIRKAGLGGAIIERKTITRSDGTVELTEKFQPGQWTAHAWLLERRHEDWRMDRDVIRDLLKRIDKLEAERNG